MKEIIAPHSFEEAKRSLQVFSQQSDAKTSLSEVDTSGGLFNWFDHKVTGDEFNRLVTQLQTIVKNLKDNDVKMIDQFGAVYNALESLDSEYIPALLTGIKSAEEASDQAKKALDRIDSTIETQEKVLAVLKSHKEKLEKLKHLESIDDLWNLQESQKDELAEIDSRIKENGRKIEEQDSKIKKQLSDVANSLNSLSDKSDLQYNKLHRIVVGLIIGTGSVGCLTIITLVLNLLKII